MIRTLHLKLLLLGCLLMAILQMDAQGWMKKYSPDAGLAINTIYPTHDGNYLATGWNLTSTTPFQRILKVDGSGNVIWKADVDSMTSLTVSNTTQTGGLVIFGYGPADAAGYNPTHTNLLKVDSNGNKVWLRTLHPERTFVGGNGNADIDTTKDGGYICTYTAIDTASGSTNHLYVSRLDSSGNILWEHAYYLADTLPVPYSIRLCPDGGFLLVAETSTSTLLAIKLDSAGNQSWTYTPTTPSYLTAVISHDGNILLVSVPYAGGPNSIIKMDLSGNIRWSQNYTTPDGSSWYGIAERTNGTYAMLGIRGGTVDRFSLSHIDTLGNFISFRTVSTSNIGSAEPIYNMGPKAITMSHEGGYIVGGWLRDDPENYSGYMIKMDSDGIVYPSTLSGSIFSDGNNNCTKDPGEIYLSPVYLNVASMGDTFNLVTADSGYFSLGLDTGVYTLQVLPPSPYWQSSSCDQTGGQLASGSDTTILLGLTPILTSPYINITGHIGHQVICREAVYTAEYCNTGTAPFTGTVEIDVDTLLTIDSTSIQPLSVTGNQYTFHVDTLGVMQCATVEIYYTAPCSQSYFQRTTCIDAHAYQDTIVNPSPQWDRSNLDMSVHYEPSTDTITFTLKNKGTGGMSLPEGLIVIEDNVILITVPTQLPSGGQTIQQVKANGATWRATINQTPFNPYSKYTTAAIEAAGTNSTGGVSLGYITQYPYNGYTSYENNTCAEIHDSYDPNEKTVEPSGAGPNQLVDTNVTLEYSIDFQNTGTAIAYTVVVTDTLTSFLNPSTMRLEASSNPCQMSISGNLVTFTFNNIQLPDSGSNFLRSTGFVKFRINQKANNIPGTVINNKAGVYFDYNAPVITNTATVRIGSVLVTGIQNIYADKAIQISAYPNPFLTSTLIKVDGENFTDLQLDIYDISGQLVKHEDAKNTNSFSIDRSSLDSGDYIFKITGNGKPVGNGKIVAQ
jgi:uncharacterized repeat protein (TIGR01451 family)